MRVLKARVSSEGLTIVIPQRLTDRSSGSDRTVKQMVGHNHQHLRNCPIAHLPKNLLKFHNNNACKLMNHKVYTIKSNLFYPFYNSTYVTVKSISNIDY